MTILTSVSPASLRSEEAPGELVAARLDALTLSALRAESHVRQIFSVLLSPFTKWNYWWDCASGFLQPGIAQWPERLGQSSSTIRRRPRTETQNKNAARVRATGQALQALIGGVNWRLGGRGSRQCSHWSGQQTHRGKKALREAGRNDSRTEDKPKSYLILWRRTGVVLAWLGSLSN